MVEIAPQKKQDEQYPLLKVDCGGGDNGGKPQVVTTLPTATWGVTCSPKRAWIIRWPEYISACWMTFILIGISFLVFYGLGMEAYRRQPVLLIKCNESNLPRDVFYHKIIPRGSSVPVLLHTDYLLKMAYEYPYLHFHVIFLVDDTIQTSFRVSGHPRFIKTFMPIPLSNTYPLYKVDENSRRELADFQNRFHNINITIMPLSKFMALTPMKYKWRNIPLPYLPFYARVFSVWQYGGVGMDLNRYNNNFDNHKLHLDRKISAILKQHNDGIKPEEYANALNKIEREEESEFLAMFCGLMHSILNETRSFLANSFPSFPQLVSAPENDLNNHNDPIVRTHRNKREIAVMDNNNATNTNSVFLNIINISNTEDLKKNEYQTLVAADVDMNKTKISKDFTNTTVEELVALESLNKTEVRDETLNKSTHPQVVMFYDLSVISDGIWPPVPVPDLIAPADAHAGLKENKPLKNINSGDMSLLSLDSEGTFIAVSSRFHPFLGRLLSAGCQRMHPKYAIQDSYISQCVGIFKKDTYCANIYLL